MTTTAPARTFTVVTDDGTQHAVTGRSIGMHAGWLTIWTGRVHDGEPEAAAQFRACTVRGWRADA